MQLIPKILALDIGDVRIGVAISDGLGLLAHPLTTLKWNNNETLLNDISNLIKEHKIAAIVLGIPYTMKGTESDQTRKVLKIYEFLKDALDVKVEQQDERLTTKLAENMLKAINKKASRNRDKIDQIAAVNILQTYLDKKRI